MGSDLALAWDEREERPLQLGIGRTTSPGKSTHRGPWRSTLLPEFLIVACTLVLIWFFRRLLVDAQRSDIELGTLLPLFLAMMGRLPVRRGDWRGLRSGSSWRYGVRSVVILHIEFTFGTVTR